MIYLKSLELTNFKSFIGNIKIPFSRNFTVITGPNGSGKSNILDAIRWVLGEQKLKTLRAERNDEVIFGGNKFYSPANYAKVELCIEVFEEEYVISRKIYRDEDSEYCINDKTTRLKDIQLFLSNLGLGRYSFVFLGQGEIEDLLLKEDERIRELIENIAGISGYHEKVKDILLKLEIIESKWNELEERRIEALKTIEVLKNEVNIANKYEELRNKLKDVQDSIKFWAWKKLKNSLEKYLEEKKEVEKRLSLIRSELIPNDNLMAELQVEYERIEGELKEIRRLIEDIDEKIFKLKLDEGILKEKKRILKEKLENLEKEKDILENKFSQIEVSKKELLEELKVYYQEDFSEFENGLKIKEKRLQELIIERTKLEDKVKAFEDIFKDFQDLTLLEKRIEKEANLLKNYRKRLNVLQNYREGIESKLIEQSRILRKKEDLYEKNKLEIVRLSNILGDLKEGVLESYPRGTREIVLNKKDKIYDVLKNLIEIPKNYMEALYNLLGNSIYDIVIENEEVARELISYLKDRRLGWATFRPLTLCKDEKVKDLPSGLEGLATRAIDVVSYDYKYERLIKNVLNNVLIFKDYQTALRYKNLLFDGWRIVTLQGEVFLPNGTVSGGFRFGVEATLNTEKAIIETEERINDLLESNKFLEKDIEKIKIEIEKSKNIAQKIDGLISKIKAKIVDKEKEISMLQDRVTLYREYEKEGKVLLNRYEELLKEIEEAEKEINALRKDYESKRIKKIELEKDLNSLNKDLENLKYRLEEIEKEKDRIIKENEMLTQMFQKCVEEYREKEANKEVLLIENKDLLEKSEKIRKEIKKLEKEWQKLREEEIILEQREKELTNRIKEVQTSLEENFEENLVLKIDLSEEELKRLEIEIVKELESLGPVNFLAKAKLEEEEKKYNFLVSQIEDVSESIKSLKKVIRDTKEEAERRFIDTFREFKIKANYNWKLFFPNADLDLFLENEENILDSNIKLRISSQKKNWKNMLMLSGGEKSLVGISLLLSAVELASVDFCFWDEIDAALDNQNAQILGKKIKELSRKKQLILISHNPVLMQYADIIYGVTLNDKGSSQVLSWKMTEEVSN